MTVDHCAVELRFEDEDTMDPPTIFYCDRPALHPGRHRARQPKGAGTARWVMTWEPATDGAE